MTTQFRFHWRPNWKILVFALLFLPLTLRLGFWQLQRADEKAAMLSMYNARQQAQPQPFDTIDHASDRQYLPVNLNFTRTNFPLLLLDNRVRMGKPGYEVLELVKSAQGLILVNRGWLATGLDRQQLPEVAALEERQLSGYLYQSPGKQIMLGPDNWPTDKPVAVIQNGSPSAVANRLGIEIYPYQLRLNESKQGLQAEWPVVNLRPAKHTGYAVQWFAMAFLLLVLTVFANSNLAQLFQRKSQE